MFLAPGNSRFDPLISSNNSSPNNEALHKLLQQAEGSELKDEGVS